MIKDQRKSKRQQMRYSAWLTLGHGQLHGCVLSNVSDSGACIDVQDATTLPDRFFLLLSNSGSARRDCRVIWRKARRVGVEFERARAGRASLVPAVDADSGAPPKAEPAEPEKVEND